MNPWAIVGGLLILVGTAVMGDHFGYGRGVDAEKVAHQTEIDGVNQALTKQKADANGKLQQAARDVRMVMERRDELNLRLGTEREKNRTATDGLHTQLAAERLRFPAAQDSGCRGGGGGADATQASPTGDPGPAYCVVSRETEEALKALAFDADTLMDDYRLLYNWAHGVDAR